jgi:hypothetical protein
MWASWASYNIRQKRLGSGGNCCCTNKQDLAGFWGNSNFEFSFKNQCPRWACYGSLQKAGSEEFALELDSF